jgi:ribonuclease HII
MSPAEIDKVVETRGRLRRLNRLEAQAMAKVITALEPNMAYVDASDIQPQRFKEHIAADVPVCIQIISEHKADVKYPIVSAASIVAKVERDRAIRKLKNKYGDIGSGYPSDPKTLNFLEKWFSQFGAYPSFVRKSWKPAKRLKIIADARQTRIA